MPNCPFHFTHDEVHNNLTAQGVPKLYFEQFYRIRDHLDDIRSPKTHTNLRDEPSLLTGRNGSEQLQATQPVRSTAYVR
jgi:hypothetical protein